MSCPLDGGDDPVVICHGTCLLGCQGMLLQRGRISQILLPAFPESQRVVPGQCRYLDLVC